MLVHLQRRVRSAPKQTSFSATWDGGINEESKIIFLSLLDVARRGSCNSMLKILQLCTVALVAVAVVAALAFASVLVDGCD